MNFVFYPLLFIIQSDNWSFSSIRRTCYSIKDQTDCYVPLEIPRDYHLPSVMAMYVVKTEKSKQNNNILNIVTKEYQIEKTLNKCLKKFVVQGFTDNKTYIEYQIYFKLINSKLNISLFLFEVYDNSSIFTEKIKGSNEKILFDIKYEGFERKQIEANESALFNVPQPTGSKTKNICLHLQHEKLEHNILLGRLTDVHANIVYQTSSVKFTYTENGKSGDLDVEFDAWIFKCRTSGVPVFNLVVLKKINKFKFKITFQDWQKNSLGHAKFTYLETRRELKLDKNTLMIFRINIKELSQVTKIHSLKHIYLDTFLIKKKVCEHFGDNVLTQEVKQFGQVRYNIHLYYARKIFKRGVMVWRPLEETVGDKNIIRRTKNCREIE